MSENNSFPEDIIYDFLSETRNTAAEVNSIALELENRGDTHTLLDDLRRKIHTQKGNAGFLGFIKISTLSHDLETELSRWSPGKKPLPPEIIQNIFDYADILQAVAEEGSEETVQPSFGSTVYESAASEPGKTAQPAFGSTIDEAAEESEKTAEEQNPEPPLIPPKPPLRNAVDVSTLFLVIKKFDTLASLYTQFLSGKDCLLDFGMAAIEFNTSVPGVLSVIKKDAELLEAVSTLILRNDISCDADNFRAVELLLEWVQENLEEHFTSNADVRFLTIINIEELFALDARFPPDEGFCLISLSIDYNELLRNKNAQGVLRRMVDEYRRCAVYSNELFYQRMHELLKSMDLSFTNIYSSKWNAIISLCTGGSDEAADMR